MSDRSTGDSLDLKLCAEVARTCPSIALGKAGRVVERVLSRSFQDLPIGTRQFSLMVTMALCGPSPVSRLAKARGLAATTLSRNLDRLRERGIVEISFGTDRREHVVLLTAKGRRELSRCLVAWREAMTTIESAIEADSLKRLLGDLAELREALDESSA